MNLSRAPLPADLALCEGEPIHIPGTIQPHGFLIGLDEPTWTVRYASENTAAQIGDPARPVLAMPVDDLIGQAAAERLRQVATEPLFARRALAVDRVRLGGETATGRDFQLVAHRFGGHVILEGERISPAQAALPADGPYRLEAFLKHMEAAATIEELLNMIARETRLLTGFDRVLVYQFDSQWNGVVLAEDRSERLPSYLGLRFPAADIPRQARELYRVNRLRLIPTSEYRPVRIRAGEASAGPLDLSLATLRSVSPVHLEYMRNMGTGSSMSISLMRGDQLWGLISCHSWDPHTVPFGTRSICDVLGQVLSLQLAAREQSATLARRVQLRSVLVRLMESMARHEQLTTGLLAEPRALLELTGATGVAVLVGGKVAVHGRTPPEAQIRALVAGLLHDATEDVFATHTLPAHYPAAEAFREVASGILAVSISQVHQSYVLWFRSETIGTLTWGGDPTKPFETNGSERFRLHPRKSFAAWVETVRGRSERWSSPEVEAARELRTAIVNIVLQSAERLAEVSEDLMRAHKELEAFSYTVSHDLRAPFRHIRGYAELLKLEKSGLLDDEGRQFVTHILESANYAGRMVDNILSFSRMGRRTLQITEVPLGEIVRDVISDQQIDLGERQVEWEVGALPTVHGDPGMLRTALQNLIENAVKYTRDRRPARIVIGANGTDGEYVVFVRDNGVGFDMRYADKLFGMFQRLHRWEDFEGTGIGLASVRRIIGRHGGRVWAESQPGQGSTFFLALPTTPPLSDLLYA